MSICLNRLKNHKLLETLLEIIPTVSIETVHIWTYNVIAVKRLDTIDPALKQLIYELLDTGVY